ncbi:hypothetical protein L1987_33897 [Smallanthus sonchifolius]|uniref:Uncharacterized protein n=1 Tax=Smallanthus sonchifolius TaxID=185202 RepID=A0ACB9HSD2_9ASTR|nr:hypothetical protein L1987_33897 [Smallanthus sonchifolius]
MFNRLSLKGIKRSNRKKMRKSKGKISGEVGKKYLRRWRKGTKEKIEFDIKNLEEDKKIGLRENTQMGSSSSVKEIFQIDISTEVGKDLDSDFKEVRDEDKEMDTDIANAETEMEVVDTVEVQNTMLPEKTIGGAEGPEINENNEGDKLSDISFGEDLQMDMEKNDGDGTSGMEESMDEECENNKEKDISPKDDKVKDRDSKKKGIPTDKTTKGEIQRIRQVREKKESLSKKKVEQDGLPSVLLGGYGRMLWTREMEVKILSKVIVDEDEGNIGYSVGDEIEVLEKLLDILHKQKNLFDSKLGRQLENNPKQQEVLELKEKYDLLMQNTGKKGVQSEAGPGENDTSADVEHYQQEKPGNSEDNGDVDHDQQQPEGVKTLENSILEVEKQASVEAVEVNKETSKKKQDCKETAKEGNTEEEKTNENVYDAPPFSIGLTQLESNNEELNTEQIEESNKEKRSDEVESSDIREAVTKEEELVWEYIFKEDEMMYKLYRKKKRNLDDEEKMKGKGKVVEDEERYVKI